MRDPVRKKSAQTWLSKPFWSQRHRESTGVRDSSIHLPTNRGRNRGSPGSTPPSTVRKKQPPWLIADWLGFVEPAPTGESKVPSPDQNPSTPLQFQRNRDEHGGVPRGDTAQHGVETPTWGSYRQRHPGRVSHSRVGIPSTPLQLR